MKVLITGGTGLIGSALTKSLLGDGHEVIVLTRVPERVNSPIPGIRYVKWDGKSSDGWAHLVEEVDVIVNLAGENLSAGLWTPKRKQMILSSRVNAGKAVVAAIENARHKPAVLIQASGVGYYGTESSQLLDEKDPIGSDFLAGISREWEASTQPVQGLGVRRVIIRSGVVFSRKGGALKLMLLPFRLFVGGPLGTGRQWLSWIHIEDEVRAIRYLIENTRANGAFNLSVQPVRNSEFSRTVGKLMRCPSFIRVPAFLLKLILGEMSTMVLDGQRASSARLTNLGFKFKYAELEGALKELV